MLRYITRHGQVDTTGGDCRYPNGDIMLTELGRKQAHLLGERLKREKFDGRIICSPFVRTLETAEIIASHTGSLIVPFAAVHEVLRDQNYIDTYRGLTLDEIRRDFMYIDPDAELCYPWWVQTAETGMDDVLRRVTLGVAEIESRYPDEPLLYVGHGASVSALNHIYNVPTTTRTTTFNCSLTIVCPGDHTFKCTYASTDHLSYAETTLNHRTRAEWDEERMSAVYDGEIVPDRDIGEVSGPRVLHIGDIDSVSYPYYKKLITVTHPDIIIHTGDLADEVKAGNSAAKYDEYKFKIRKLLSMLDESGARIVIVCGNNDLVTEIRSLLPRAEIYPENSVVDLDGVECRVGHYVDRMTFDKKWTFYGHSVAGDKWKYTFNANGSDRPFRFNSLWGSTLCSPADDTFCSYRRPPV